MKQKQVNINIPAGPGRTVTKSFYCESVFLDRINELAKKQSRTRHNLLIYLLADKVKYFGKSLHQELEKKIKKEKMNWNNYFYIVFSEALGNGRNGEKGNVNHK